MIWSCFGIWYRKISTDEKRKIARALDRLPVEDVDKALEIVAEDDPSFELKADLVDLDLDAQVYFPFVLS